MRVIIIVSIILFTLPSCATVYGDGDAQATGNVNIGNDAIDKVAGKNERDEE